MNLKISYIKKTFFLFLILFFLTGINLIYGEGIKIGVVNFKKVFYSYKKTKELQNELSEIRKKYSNEIEEIKKEISKLEEDLSKNSQKYSDEEYRKRTLIILIKKEDLNNLIKKRNKDLQDFEKTRSEPIIKEIKDVIETFRKELGLDIIIDSNIALAYEKKLDYTEEIINRLNA